MSEDQKPAEQEPKNEIKEAELELTEIPQELSESEMQAVQGGRVKRRVG